jgi:hypothetical protein
MPNDLEEEAGGFAGGFPALVNIQLTTGHRLLATGYLPLTTVHRLPSLDLAHRG